MTCDKIDRCHIIDRLEIERDVALADLEKERKDHAETRRAFSELRANRDRWLYRCWFANRHARQIVQTKIEKGEALLVDREGRIWTERTGEFTTVNSNLYLESAEGSDIDKIAEMICPEECQHMKLYGLDMCCAGVDRHVMLQENDDGAFIRDEGCYLLKDEGGE